MDIQPDVKSGPLSVTWPLDNMAYANSTTHTHVIGDTSIKNSLHHSVRVVIAGKPKAKPNTLRGEGASVVNLA